MKGNHNGGEIKMAKDRKFAKRGAILPFHFLLFTCLTCLAFLTACQPNASIMNSRSDAPPASSANSVPAKSSLEGDLETLRTADFDFIYVFRRKDGAVFTDDDKKFVKANSPRETNRFLLSDEEKAVAAGSKYPFTPENLKALGARFAIENFSKPGAEQKIANVGANVNVKIK